jgi:hypothetical protein
MTPKEKAEQTDVEWSQITGNLNFDANIWFYPIVIKDENFEKLLAVQTKPEVKYWFKDKEVTLSELIEILKKA